MIKLDGNYGEGGGQILRTALALSCITKKPFEITNIRKNRPKPGLKQQHINCIKALNQIYEVKTEDLYPGSETIRFIPFKLKKRTIDVDIGTAGSITLLLQAILPACISEQKNFTIRIKGGTDVKWSMQWDFLNEIVLPNYRRFADIKSKLNKRGYYPKGGGEVEIKVKPLKESIIRSIDLTNRGKLIYIKGISHASRDLMDAKVAERQASGAKNSLLNIGCTVNIDARYSKTASTGSGISLWAIYSLKENEIDIFNPIRIGADTLGEKGNKAEEVGENTARKLLYEIDYNACCDQHLTDNMIPLLALHGGKIKTSNITKHTLSNIYTCENFIDNKFMIHEETKTIEYVKDD